MKSIHHLRIFINDEDTSLTSKHKSSLFLKELTDGAGTISFGKLFQGNAVPLR